MNAKTTRLFGWIGMTCLLSIVAVKAVRFVDATLASTFLVGIAPSMLGPPGLFFLIASGSGRLSRLTLAQTATLVGIIALLLEFAQLLPRQGILTKVHYTFDWFDIIASLLSLLIGYFVASIIANTRRAP